MIADLHIHTPLCNHSMGKPAEFVAAAVKAGLTTLGIADHAPWPDGFDPKYRMSAAQLPLYRGIVEEFRREAEPLGIEILYGMELDYVPGRMEEVNARTAGESFDYLLGSVHYLKGSGMYVDHYVETYFKEGGVDALYLSFAENFLELIQTTDFDILAHCDLPKKYDGFIPTSFQPFIRAMTKGLELAHKKGMALELNTAGLRNAFREAYPSRPLLEAACRLGMPLCFGSDAHRPFEVAHEFAAGRRLAKEAGFTKFSLFRKRKRFDYQL